MTAQAGHAGAPVNLLARLGYSAAEIEGRLEGIWFSVFDPASPDSFYRERGDGTAFVFDTGNDDVRTEGMSYAMMMALQRNRQDVFDRLWAWTMRHMYLEEGLHRGYFAWSCSLEGKKNAFGPAPDGEEYFALALLFAESRWGNRDEGGGTPALYDYGAHARRLLELCVRRDETVGGMPMWDRQRRLIKFICEADFSDPSYHLPHFYRLFAERGNPSDAAFWREAAEASSRYIALCAHAETGLSPEYAHWDGAPNDDNGFGGYYSDAYRVAANIGLNAAWGDPDPSLRAVADRLLRFFDGIDPKDYRKYALDGTPLGIPALHPLAIAATNAQAALALWDQESQTLPAHAERAVRLFWEMPPRAGTRRYYDNCLYFFALQALAGEYRVW